MPELFKGIRDVVAEWLAAYDAAAETHPETEEGIGRRMALQDIERKLDAALVARRRTIAYNMV